VYWDPNHLDADPEAGLDELAKAQSVRQASALAALAQELRDRQITVLRGIYPAWDIALELDSTGRLWWTAVPNRPLTGELSTERVVRFVRYENAIALAAALAWQSALISSVENPARFPHVRSTRKLKGAAGMTSALEQTCDLDLRGAFRRFYVWRYSAGTWHARPLPKLTRDEIAYQILPELVADSPIQLAYQCTWQRSRRKVYRYLQKYARRNETLESAS
jgi:hypothetical protein